MTTIDRSILKTFVGSYVLLLGVCAAFFIFADLLFNFDEFTENPALSAAQVFANMLDYYGHNLPLYYQQLGGILMAVASGFTYAILLKNNELTPLVAAGVPLQRLAVPVLLASVGLMALWMANSEIVVPHFAQKIARVHEDLGGTREVVVQCVRDDKNAVLAAAELHARRGLLVGVSILVPNDRGVPQHLVKADAAAYDAARRTWALDRGARLDVAASREDDALGRRTQWTPLSEYAFGLTPDEILLRQSSYWGNMLSIRQMNRLLRAQNLPNLASVEKTRYIRFTQPLLAWILMLLVMPYFLTREPGNVLVAGGKAVGVAGLCLATVFIAHSASSDAYSVRMATALPVFIFGPTAVLLFANVKT